MELQQADGQAIITPSGGTPNYTYLWDTNANNQTDSIADSLAFGNYSVIITDNNNCIDTLQIVVGNNNAASISFSSYNNLNCYNDSSGSITASLSGGTPNFSYTWIKEGNTINASRNVLKSII